MTNQNLIIFETSAINCIDLKLENYYLTLTSILSLLKCGFQHLDHFWI